MFAGTVFQKYEQSVERRIVGERNVVALCFRSVTWPVYALVVQLGFAQSVHAKVDLFAVFGAVSLCDGPFARNVLLDVIDAYKPAVVLWPNAAELLERLDALLEGSDCRVLCPSLCMAAEQNARADIETKRYELLVNN